MATTPDSSTTSGLLSSPREGLIAFLQSKAEKVREQVTARREGAATFRLGTDRDWAEAGALTKRMTGQDPTPMPAAERERSAQRQDAIASKLESELAFFEAAALSLQSATARAEQAEQEAERLRTEAQALEMDCRMAATRLSVRTGNAALDRERVGGVEAYCSIAQRLSALLRGPGDTKHEDLSRVESVPGTPHGDLPRQRTGDE
jgi:hypothetical protein